MTDKHIILLSGAISGLVVVLVYIFFTMILPWLRYSPSENFYKSVKEGSQGLDKPVASADESYFDELHSLRERADDLNSFD